MTFSTTLSVTLSNLPSRMKISARLWSRNNYTALWKMFNISTFSKLSLPAWKIASYILLVELYHYLTNLGTVCLPSMLDKNYRKIKIFL